MSGECCEATHDEIVDGALKHYREISGKACDWCSTVEHALEFYRKNYPAPSSEAEPTAPPEQGERRKAYSVEDHDAQAIEELTTENATLATLRKENEELKQLWKNKLESLVESDKRITNLQVKLAEAEKENGAITKEGQRVHADLIKAEKRIASWESTFEAKSIECEDLVELVGQYKAVVEKMLTFCQPDKNKRHHVCCNYQADDGNGKGSCNCGVADGITALAQLKETK